jgi:hypothetical protein
MTQRPCLPITSALSLAVSRAVSRTLKLFAEGKQALPDLFFQLLLADCSNTARCNPGKKRDALISKRLLIAVAISTSVSEKPPASST